MQYKIRDIEVSPALSLAPMEGVTDLTFRRLIRSIGGCGMMTTEFIPARNLAESVKGAFRLADFDPDEHPIAIQIYGNRPDVIAEGARIVEDLGADVVDFNMGCPSKNVCARSGGSALLKDPTLAREIVRAIRGATSLPFTVKMRAGWDSSTKNAPEIARMCEDEGVEGLAVHWRTRQDRYGGDRDLRIIREVKEAVKIPVLANGDIVDIRTAVEAIRETGCDGLMIGRGAIRDPWVFAKIAAHWKGLEPVVVSELERRRVLLEYLDAIQLGRTEKGVLGRFKKISRHFTEGVAGGDVLRQRIFHSHSIQELRDVVDMFFFGADLQHPQSDRKQEPEQ